MLKSVAPSIASVVSESHVNTVVEFFLRKPHRTIIISGAGIDTHSGIPDYRSPERPEYNPIKVSRWNILTTVHN